MARNDHLRIKLAYPIHSYVIYRPLTMVTKVDHGNHRSNDRYNHRGYYDGYYNGNT